jgi:Reverse transcriptase (RNA-dependent DNA polymerase)
MNPEIQELIRERRKAERRMKRNHTTENIIEFKRLRAKVRWAVKKARKKAWEEYSNTLTNQTPTQEIWKKIGKIKGRPNSSGIQQIRTSPDQTATTNPEEIANLLADHFSKNSSTEGYHPSFKELKQRHETEDIDINLSYNAEYNTDLTEEEMTAALQDCKGSSPGPDQVEYELIKQLNWSTKKKILDAYNQIWATGTFPAAWTTATVIAVPKPGKDPERVESYRPIALTSCLCKLMERMVNRRLVFFLENNNLISNQQFGFRKGRSTLDVLAILENEACESINKGRFMSICSLDLTGAYDRCWRRGILNNLTNMTIQGRLLAFSKNFMTTRTIRVAVGNHYSNLKPMENGVPQGAVLSVTSFLVGIDPIHNTVFQCRHKDGGIC